MTERREETAGVELDALLLVQATGSRKERLKTVGVLFDGARARRVRTTAPT
jgi:hypothetical protein